MAQNVNNFNIPINKKANISRKPNKRFSFSFPFPFIL